MIPIYPYYSQETKCKQSPVTFPPQHQDHQPGLEYLMNPTPISDNPAYKGSGKLKGKVAIITGGDSGIGRAVAIGFSKEGADVAIVYLYEREDALATKQMVEQYGGRCLLIEGDLRKPEFSSEVVRKTIGHYGCLDILVLNQAVQFPQKCILDISDEQLEDTYRTNIFPHFYLTKAALPHLKAGSSIISTASVTAYAGAPLLIDYSSTKGAIVSFTRSLSLQLVSCGIRVNAVAPGPIWTPLIVSSYSAEYVKTFGLETPMKRAGQPFELAPTYIYLASDDSSFVTGQVLHVNGGVMTET
ncbi:NAD(P)-dependent dehydrogenase (short-subunit alcohol dehydrogenase family) [Paenibacillus sp. BK033]|uniref:SDR family oxidoreductase n=1 Tax=Paenibacillus sp. BK033 TaxID=2512133 RepID=UPI00104CB316|nr:SDR family oxidoreductase [Paenibacillus sp. BK033]TCN01245.1 NAD(P)-dependent dehydrogenase (short-subunit alcohol dehydrogenase family) [Paenibacillus sp. BK033]